MAQYTITFTPKEETIKLAHKIHTLRKQGKKFKEIGQLVGRCRETVHRAYAKIYPREERV